MIKSLASKVAEDIFNGIKSHHTRRISSELHGKICRLFDQINAITRVETLRIPSSNHLEKLKGDLAGYWSIRINKQWRIIFKWKENNAHEVDIVDYH